MKDNRKKIYVHYVGIGELNYYTEGLAKIKAERAANPDTENEIHIIVPTLQKENKKVCIFKPTKANDVKQHLYIELHTGPFTGKDRYTFLAMSYDVYKFDETIYVEIVGTQSDSNVEIFEYH